MKILVSGGAGFIGSHLVDALVSTKHSVVIVDNLSTGRKPNINTGAKFYKLDIQSPKLGEVIKKEKPRIIYHLAAHLNLRKSLVDPIFDAKNNILGSLNLAEQAVRYKVAKFIFISTGGAMYDQSVRVPTPDGFPPRPLSPYGIAKLSFEKYLSFYQAQYKLAHVILRPANIYGPRQNYLGEAGVVAIFCHQLSRHQPLKIFGGQQTRDFLYVKDMIQACLKVMPLKISGTYNISTARQIKIINLAKKLIQISERPVRLERCAYVKGEQTRSCLSFNKIKQELGWRPKYSLEQGLEETWQWFK